MKITVLSIGKIKEKYLSDAILEYSKRLSRYCNLEILQMPDEKAPEKLSDAQRRQILDKEGARLLSGLREDACVIALAIEGKQLSSEELAEKIGAVGLSGVSHIQFVIGGSLGLSDAVLARAEFKLSFSKMTFPHQLMRVILLEQIYRSYRILNNEPYHK